MVAPKRRSISLPITLSTVAVVLTIALLVCWIVVIASNMASVTDTFVSNVWLLVGGIVSFITVLSVLVMFTVFLIREIGEVRRQTSFIDSVTHELKTPLASLRLAAQTLARPQLAPDRREQLRVMMLDDVSRLVALVDGILDASRIAGGGRPEPSDFDEVTIADLAEDIAQVLTTRHRLPLETVEFDLEPDLSLHVDPHALRTVLTNLVDNALKYSPDNPKVRVRARRHIEDAQVEIAVTDRGIGIAKGDLKRIFDRFYRVPEEAVRNRHGTGLGLFVVSAMVKTMGGKVEASSPGVGHGTTVRMLLPLRYASS